MATRWFLIGPALVLAAGAFVLGAIPWPQVTTGVSAFADPHTIVDAVLHHPRPLRVSILAAPSWTHVCLLAGATAVCAVLATALRPRIRALTGIHRLHDIHNGSVGDYVTWLASGTAVITGTLVLLR